MAAAALTGHAADAPSRDEAQKELFAARWAHAAELYQQLMKADPSWAAGWDALVRARLEAHQTPEAYAAADEALRLAPGTAEAQTALGRVCYRKGEIAKAEAAFRKALALNPKYPGALAGMARIYALVSKFRSGEQLWLTAWHAQPDDPELMYAHAGTLKGAEHIAELERVLAVYGPETREARAVRKHIAADRAIGDRKLRVLQSAYEPYELKLMDLLDGPRRSRGLGLRVRFNDRFTGTLLLDTGAHGISLTPQAARHAELEKLEGEGTETYGIGDDKPGSGFAYLAREVRVGELAWINYPIDIFQGANNSEHDGIIGADAFAQFLIEIDFPRFALRLTPYAGGMPNADAPQDASDPPAGFHRVYRHGHLLLMPTFINDGAAKLFVIDSGSSASLIDKDAAREATKVHADSYIVARGIQGRVQDVGLADDVHLTFAGMRQDNRDLVAISLRAMNDQTGMEQSGILGMPVLRQMKLAIDYRDGAVRFDYRGPSGR